MKLTHLHESNKQQEGILDRTKARFAGAKEWLGQAGKNVKQAWSGTSKDPMANPSDNARTAKVQSIAAAKAKEILTDWYKLGLTKNPPNETNIQRATDAFIALLNSKTSKGNQYSAQSASRALAGKMSGVSVTENLDEGWFDRLKANVSGVGAKATSGIRNVAGNVGSIVGGSGGKEMSGLRSSDEAQKQAKINSIAFNSAKDALNDFYKLGFLSSLNDRDVKYLGNQFVQILSGTRKAAAPAKPAAKPAAAPQQQRAAAATAKPAVRRASASSEEPDTSNRVQFFKPGQESQHPSYGSEPTTPAAPAAGKVASASTPKKPTSARATAATRTKPTRTKVKKPTRTKVEMPKSSGERYDGLIAPGTSNAVEEA